MQINPRVVWSFVIPHEFVGASVPHPSRRCRHSPAIENKRRREGCTLLEGREGKPPLPKPYLALRCDYPGRAWCTTLPLPGMDAEACSGRGSNESQSPSCGESGARHGVVAPVGFYCPRSPKSFVLQGNSLASDGRADVPAGVGKRPDLLPVPRESHEATSGPSPGLARWGAGRGGEREGGGSAPRTAPTGPGASSRAPSGPRSPRAALPPRRAWRPHRRQRPQCPGDSGCQSVRPPARLFPGRQVKFDFTLAGAGVKGCLCWSKQINAR